MQGSELIEGKQCNLSLHMSPHLRYMPSIARELIIHVNMTLHYVARAGFTGDIIELSDKPVKPKDPFRVI